MSLGKAQIIHIVVEVIILVAISLYFQSQNKKLKQDIAGLKSIVAKHDQALKILFANVPVQKNQSGLHRSPEDTVAMNRQEYEDQVPTFQPKCCLSPVKEEHSSEVEREEDENEQDGEFDKEVQEELQKINSQEREEKTSILTDPDISVDITGKQDVSFSLGRNGIDTVIVIEKDEEDDGKITDANPTKTYSVKKTPKSTDKKEEVQFLPPNPRRRSKKKGG